MQLNGINALTPGLVPGQTPGLDPNAPGAGLPGIGGTNGQDPMQDLLQGGQSPDEILEKLNNLDPEQKKKLMEALMKMFGMNPMDMLKAMQPQQAPQGGQKSGGGCKGGGGSKSAPKVDTAKLESLIKDLSNKIAEMEKSKTAQPQAPQPPAPQPSAQPPGSDPTNPATTPPPPPPVQAAPEAPAEVSEPSTDTGGGAETTPTESVGDGAGEIAEPEVEIEPDIEPEIEVDTGE